MLKKMTVTILVFLVMGIGIADATTWILDADHSRNGFKVKHLMISNVNGRFDGFEGQVDYNPQDLEKSSVEVTVDLSSVNTDRRDFGLTWSKALETGVLVVDNTVKIILEVELIKM